MKPSIGQLRPSAGIDAELDWFFNRSECDMGDQSNFLAMLGRHGPGSALPSPEDAAEAAHRARRIRGWLTTIDSADAGVLQCAYELRGWPIPLWDQLGRLTGVVVRSACALDPLPADRHSLQVIEMARAEWLAEQCLRGAIDPSFAQLRLDAQARFARAGLAYSRARAR